MSNGFFGQIQGPFQEDSDIFPLIQAQCLDTISYISKIGIYYVKNRNLQYERPVRFPEDQIYIKFNNDNEMIFQIGKTGILQFEDVQITAISFEEDVDDSIYIDYQYVAVE